MTRCAHSLNGIGHSLDFRDDGVVVVRVEPAYVADLSAGIGVERSVVEHDLGMLAGLELLRADCAAVITLMMASTSHPVERVW